MNKNDNSLTEVAFTSCGGKDHYERVDVTTIHKYGVEIFLTVSFTRFLLIL